MKKIILLMLVFLVLLCGCNENIENESSKESEKISDEESFEIEESVNDEESDDIYQRKIQIKLPDLVTYSCSMRSDYRETFAEYISEKNDEDAVCYAWLENNELKFGISKVSSVSDYETIKSSLKAATLGEMRAIINSNFDPLISKRLGVVPLDDRLLCYRDALEYALGIGENCIECHIVVGNYRIDIPFYGEGVNEFYEFIDGIEKNYEPVDKIEFDSELRNEYISVTFYPSGSMDFNNVAMFYPQYGIYPNGYISRSNGFLSSIGPTQYLINDEHFQKIRQTVFSLLESKGIDYPFAKADESWCTAQIGLYGNDIVIKGEKVEELRQKVKDLSHQALELTENDDSENDVKTAIYIEFYEGMEFKYEFVLYTNDNCIPFRSSSENLKRMLKCENGSYNDLIIYLTDGK